jgi:hypothetical protein
VPLSHPSSPHWQTPFKLLQLIAPLVIRVARETAAAAGASGAKRRAPDGIGGGAARGGGAAERAVNPGPRKRAAIEDTGIRLPTSDTVKSMISE